MPEILGVRALNRATLARQLLLDRADLSALDAVTHLAGVQAQEPQEPFAGLWSRLRDFDPAELSGLLTDRLVVRAHLMRRTVHLLDSADLLAWRSRHDALLRQRILGAFRRDLAGVDLDDLAAAGRDVLADGVPRTMGELVRAVADRWPGVGALPLGQMLISALIPVVQVPPRGLWRTTGPAGYLPVAAWLGREPDPLPADGSDPVGQALVRRYLAAYGPASTADLRAWSGLAGLPKAVAAIRDELIVLHDDRGRRLLDLPEAPRPDPDTPAPVRFLPAFDNSILGYDDRTRIIDDQHRNLSVAGERVVLVDGRVSATWTVTDAEVTVQPLRPLTRPEHAEVQTEAEHLADFLSDHQSHRAHILKP